MSYETECPKCGKPLYVVGYSVSTNIPLCEDGFSPADDSVYDTTDERVMCARPECDFECELHKLYREDVDEAMGLSKAAYKKGQRDFLAGLSIEDNPYGNLEARRQWEYGWKYQRIIEREEG